MQECLLVELSHFGQTQKTQANPKLDFLLMFSRWQIFICGTAKHHGQAKTNMIEFLSDLLKKKKESQAQMMARANQH